MAEKKEASEETDISKNKGPQPDSQGVYETYTLNVQGMKAVINIIDKGEFVPIYEVSMPGIGDATRILLMSIKPELLSLVPIDTSKVTDPEYMDKIKGKYVEAANLIINKYLPDTEESVKNALISYIKNMMLGMGDLEVFIADEHLEEITVNTSKEPIWIFHKRLGWCKSNVRIFDEATIYDISEHIGRLVGRQINNIAPLMDAELPDGSRVNATLFPISQKGNTITIRKFSKNPWTMPLLIKSKEVSPEIASLIWLCIQNEISLIVSGGTASGKTSFLNAMSIFMPANRRVITIEETKELTIPDFIQWVPMLTRQANPEGKGEIVLYNLMINALRQRPDIVIVGEIRTKNDAQTLFEAVHTGHSVYGTLHADNSQDAIIRMTNPPIEIPKIMLNAIGGVVALFRHRRLGIRRLFEFGEIERNGDANVVYRWNLRSDAFVQVSDLTRLVDTISMYSGYTKNEIADDIGEKSKILEWMIRNDVTSVNETCSVIANYYKNKEKVLQIVDDKAKYDPNVFKVSKAE